MYSYVFVRVNICSVSVKHCITPKILRVVAVFSVVEDMETGSKDCTEMNVWKYACIE